MNPGRAEPQLREYRCASCGHTEHAQVLPEAWYTVQGSTGDPRPPLKLGIYCTPTCMANSSEQLEKRLQAHLQRLGLTDETEGLARAIEDAVTLHGRGYSIAQISDLIQKRAKKISRWLRIAGVHTVVPTIPKQASRAKPRNVAEHVAQSPTRVAKSLINELEQVGFISDATFESTPSGLPHEPSFTVLASTIKTDTSETVTAQVVGTGRKSDAREAAAAALIERLIALCD